MAADFDKTPPSRERRGVAGDSGTVAKKQEAAPVPSFFWKGLGIAAGVLAVLLVVAAGVMFYIAGTPAYSLYKLRAAVEAGDSVTFDEHFDTRKVVSNAIQREVGGLPAGPRIVSQKAVDMLIPASEKLIQERILERLADKTNVSPMLKMDYQGTTYVNNAAVVTLRDPSDGSETRITLERLPNRQWKIVDLDLNKAGVAYSLAEARTFAESYLQPNMPKSVKPPMIAPDGTLAPPQQ